MYIIKTIKEILEDKNTDWKDFKLCYIDNIPETFSDWTEETRKYMATPRYLEDKAKYGWNNPYLKLQDYPDPNFIPLKQEMYAYFTDIDLFHEQWGDDWNDRPYEHNAGLPYDSITRNEEHTILMVPYYIDPEKVVYPRDYGNGNSPFTVEQINYGAVPWIFVWNRELKKSSSIFAEIDPLEFINKLEQIKEML